jgi:hypothetical protein
MQKDFMTFIIFLGKLGSGNENNKVEEGNKQHNGKLHKLFPGVKLIGINL